LAACSSSATGVTVSDEAEAKVLSGRLPAGTPITAPKSVIGESWASAALAAVVVADLVAHRQLVPPIASLDTPVDDQLGFVVGAPAPVAAGPVLLTANALGGTASAVVVGPYSEMSSRGGGNS
ncbi:MAG TPA: hypothetical protein VJM33_05345, partial [Microthrixaceae bacterium]|nr:hypothetical protein [Microthrixaceae bacterium]